MADTASPLLRLPAEIRLLLYHLLLVDENRTFDTSTRKPQVVGADYHVYENAARSVEPSKHILSIRTEAPDSYSLHKAQPSKLRSRTSYHIRCDRFRARCMETTYCAINNHGIHPAILAANRQIHSEAASVLYGAYTFDFGGAIEAVVPFLSDLTSESRSHIKRLSLVKRSLPYDKEFDRCEWANACRCLSTDLSLTQLSLAVVAGKPIGGWDGVHTFTKNDFGVVSKLEGMEWMQQLTAIRGLQRLDVEAYVEHCPPPMSNAMAFFVNFSASIESGFVEFMRSEMIAVAA